jgi:hypothetical protein
MIYQSFFIYSHISRVGERVLIWKYIILDQNETCDALV